MSGAEDDLRWAETCSSVYKIEFSRVWTDINLMFVLLITQGDDIR